MRLTFLVLAMACHPAPRDLAAPTDARGCRGASLLPVPQDLAARGPWHVGVRTVRAADTSVEVWYPSTSAGPPTRYDVRTWMPAAEAAKIPDADNAWLACDCARDAAIDTTHGPYPVVVFLHGAASFRAQSTSLVTHWASRGFIVIAPDLPGVGLDAALGGARGAPFGTVLSMIDLVENRIEPDPLGSLRPAIDPHVAVVGHSLGAILSSSITDRSEVEIRIALAGALPAESTASLLGVYGERDQIARPPSDVSTPRRRIAIIAGAGHLAFTDLCDLGAKHGGPLAIAKSHGVLVPEILERLAMDGCRPTDAPASATAPRIRGITSGALEETLHCDPSATARLTAFGL